MKVSDRRIKANRENSTTSSGPRTPEGKIASSRNSVKHGLFSRALVFASEEEKATFDELQRELSEDLKPVGRLQELMVEEIAVCAWKLQVVQQLIERELSHRAGTALAPTIEKFMAKSIPLKLPLPGVGVPSAQGTAPHDAAWLPWQIRDLVLKIGSGDDEKKISEKTGVQGILSDG